MVEFVEHYNYARLHSAIGYVTPADKLAGQEMEVVAEGDRKLEAARGRRRQVRQLASSEDNGGVRSANLSITHKFPVSPVFGRG